MQLNKLTDKSQIIYATIIVQIYCHHQVIQSLTWYGFQKGDFTLEHSTRIHLPTVVKQWATNVTEAIVNIGTLNFRVFSFQTTNILCKI